MQKCLVCKGFAQPYLTKKLNYTNKIYEIYKCQTCGFGFVNPMPPQDEILSCYQNGYYAGEQNLGYLSRYEDLEEGLKKTYLSLLKKVISFCGQKTFSAVLDVGCAYGFFLDCAAQFLGSNLRVGIDISDITENIVRQKGHFFIKGLFEKTQIPFKFDLIFMGDVLEHFRNPHKVFNKIDLLLKQNGIIVITTVNFSSLAARLLKAHWRLMTPPEHLMFWTPKSLKILFGKRGWQGIVSNYWLFYPKNYVKIAFKRQFGFSPFFLKFVPLKILPIPSYDTKMAIFKKP